MAKWTGPWEFPTRSSHIVLLTRPRIHRKRRGPWYFYISRDKIQLSFQRHACSFVGTHVVHHTAIPLTAQLEVSHLGFMGCRPTCISCQQGWGEIQVNSQSISRLATKNGQVCNNQVLGCIYIHTREYIRRRHSTTQHANQSTQKS